MSTAAERQKAYRDRKRGGPPTGRKVVPCPSIAAARRHQRASEPMCAGCAGLWKQHQAEMYANRKNDSFGL